MSCLVHRKRVKLFSDLAMHGGVSFVSELKSLSPLWNGDDWISLSEERRGLQGFLRHPEFATWMREAGREAMALAMSAFSATPSEMVTFRELFYKTPAYLHLSMTYLTVYPQTSDNGKKYQITLRGLEVCQPDETDLFFILGHLDYLLHFFQLKRSVVAVKKVPFEPSETLLSQNPDIKQSRSKITITLEIKEDQTEEFSADQKIKAYDAYVHSVLEKTQELIRDKRDLHTAIEYLNVANEQLERELRANKKELMLARNIQKGFVPPRIPDWRGLQFWVKFFPLTEVSGDFYDYIPLGGHKLGLVVSDASGHGVPAALMTAIGKLSFRNHRLDSPGEIFRKVNLDLLQYVKRESYLTSFYMVIDSDYNILYSSAAAPPPIILRYKTGTTEELLSRGTLLGMFPDAGSLLKDSSTALEPGDKIFIFTDGFIESINTNDEPFGMERLHEAIASTRYMAVQEASEHVMSVYNRFILGTDPRDDVTVITVMLSQHTERFNQLVSDARTAQHDKDLDTASSLLAEAISIFPRHPNTLYLYGKVLAQNGEYPRAMEILQHYNTLQPYNADSYTIRAYCSYRSGLPELARDELKRSLSLRTENPIALYNLIVISRKLGFEEEATEYLRQLKKIRPNWKKIQFLF